MAPQKPNAGALLNQTLDEMVIAIGKAFRDAKRDGTGTGTEAAAAFAQRVPDITYKWHSILDDIECDILRAKAVLTRDLNQARAARAPPAPDPRPVAPPAPMALDIESPKMAKKPPVGPQSLQTPLPTQGQAKPLTKPVAPFPNMGVEPTAPGSPSLLNVKHMQKPMANQPTKPIGRPGAPNAAPGRPMSVPPNNPPNQVPQIQRPASAIAVPQHPQTPQMKTVVPAATMTPQGPKPAVPAPNMAPTAPPPGGKAAGNLYANMTFSPVSPASPGMQRKQAAVRGQLTQLQQHQLQLQQQLQYQPQPAQQPQPQQVQIPQQQQQPQQIPQPQPQPQPQPIPAADMTPAAIPNGSAPQEIQNNINHPPPSNDDLETKIDGLFDLGPGSMDNLNLEYDLSGDGDNNEGSSNFNDMYFGNDTGGGSGGSEGFGDGGW